MTDGPLVFVIVPVYNGERPLTDCLQSTVDQTCRPLELIVVDDGSTDGTAAIIESFPGEVSTAQPNGGVSVARNTGPAHASGEFLAFLDADDYGTADKLDRQLDCLVTHPPARDAGLRARTRREPPAPRRQCSTAICSGCRARPVARKGEAHR